MQRSWMYLTHCPLMYTHVPNMAWLCLFVCSSHLRIFHSLETITGEGLQILTYTGLLQPLGSEGSLVCHTYWFGASVYNGYLWGLRNTHTCCQAFGSGPVRYDFVKGHKSCGPNTKSCQKPYKFDLEVKDKGHTGVMNVCASSSHGDTPMCQTWYANVKAKRSNGLDTNLHRQTDRRTDRVLLI